MNDTVRLEVDSHVATVTLNRPQKMNALTLELLEALVDAGRSIRSDASVRAVVLRGAGDNFCAGMDTSVFAAGNVGGDNDSRMAPMQDSPANFYQRPALIWSEVEVPVIAALSGVVFGGGMQIALGADLRIAAPDTRCSIMEMRWGLVPDMGITVTSRGLLRRDHLRELVYSGRVVDADEALQLGLVSRIDPSPADAALALARQLAGQSPDAVRAAKQLLNHAFDDAPGDALAREARLQSSLIGRPNQVEAVMANVQKRAPEFRDS